MRKGQFNILQSAALGLGIAAIVIAYVLMIMGNVNASFDNSSAPEAVAVQEGIDGLATFPENFGMIALIIVAVIVIGLLLGLGARKKG